MGRENGKKDKERKRERYRHDVDHVHSARGPMVANGVTSGDNRRHHRHRRDHRRHDVS